MYRELINSLTTLELFTLSITILMFLCFIAAFISSFLYQEPMDEAHRDIANTLIGILSGGFSILLAFVIINAWNYQLRASDMVSKEASYLGLTLRNITVFPEKFRKRMKETIAQYLVAVRVSEWESMHKGKASPEAWRAITTIYSALGSYTPVGNKETTFYGQLLVDVNNVVEARRERLNALDSVIPATLRNALIVGCLSLVIILGSIRGELYLFNLLPALFFAGVLGFNLALALSFDYPYSGDISISNAPFYQGKLGEISDKVN